MRSAALFLLIFCYSVGQARSQASVPIHDGIGTREEVYPELPILWDELRGLKELVLSLKMEEVGQRQALRRVESQLRDSEVEAEEHRQSLKALQEAQERQVEELRRRLVELEEQNKERVVDMLELQFRMNSSESSVDNLKRKNSVLSEELPFLQTRLRASERTVEQLRRKNAVLAARLCNAESVMEELRGQISEFPASNGSSVTSPEVSMLESRLNIHLLQLQENSEDQLSEMRNKLNSNQRHLDELRRNAAGG
ncbi:uncharacterized protein FYW49_011229 [Xenentodon cancila]